MPRKGHKKSRHGCNECKRRHVKCDETPGPTCVNCQTASIRCSYNNQPRTALMSAATTPALESSVTRSHLYSLEPDFNSGIVNCHDNVRTTSLDPITSISVNLDHLELLHNFSTEVYRSFTTDDALAFQCSATMIKFGLRYPFLMHEILALSALHLSIHCPERSTYHRAQASALQALALKGCTQVLADVNDENCVAIFSFASLVGIHSISEVFIYHEGDFNSFLDKLTGSITLFRGVRTVIAQCWEYLKTSELSGLIAAGRILQENPSDSQQECKPLTELVRHADISKASLKAYEDSIVTLQQVFNVENAMDREKATTSMLFAWLVTSDASYISLLTQRRPEAMIILAYYAVILHHRRSSWGVGNAGTLIIQSITQYLGNHWARWLDWPNSVIEETHLQSTS